jgi:serine/threonine-protein kinase
VRFRSKQTLGKYRIQRLLAAGGFAEVYRALDTIEGIPVALKIPHDHMVTDALLEDFRNEVRLTARLDHPNVDDLLLERRDQPLERDLLRPGLA